MGIHAQTMVNARIAKLRARTGLDHKDFAELMGVSVASLRNYEADKTDPSGSFFVKICEVFGPVVVGWVLGHGNERDIKTIDVRYYVSSHDRKKSIRNLTIKKMLSNL